MSPEGLCVALGGSFPDFVCHHLQTRGLLLIESLSPLLKLLGLTPSNKYAAWPAKRSGRRTVCWCLYSLDCFTTQIVSRPKFLSPSAESTAHLYAVSHGGVFFWRSDLAGSSTTKAAIQFVSHWSQSIGCIFKWCIITCHICQERHCALTWSANQPIKLEPLNAFSHVEADKAARWISTPPTLKQRSFTLIGHFIRYQGWR